MKATDALREVAKLSAAQWGLLTAAQAAERGVDRVTLTRLANAQQIVRLSHGVYRDAGAPSDQFEELRAAWLSVNPKLLAEQRLRMGPAESTPASGTTAAELHGIGDLYVGRFEFTSPVRRQSQRSELRYRIRDLAPGDVTIKEGLPVTTLERTIADLVEERQALPHVATIVADATRQRPIDEERMVDLLEPLAARSGFRRRDGAALWEHLTELAGIDVRTTAGAVAASGLGQLVTREYLDKHSSAFKAIQEQIGKIQPNVFAQQTEVMRTIQKLLPKIQSDVLAKRSEAVRAIQKLLPKIQPDVLAKQAEAVKAVQEQFASQFAGNAAVQNSAMKALDSAALRSTLAVLNRHG